MLIHIFKSILVMSAVGSLLSVFLLSIAPLTRKLFSPKWQYYIWLTVLIVMLFPVHFGIPVNSIAIPTLMPEQTENITFSSPKTDNQAVIRQSEKPSNQKMALPQNLLYCLASIWLFGVAATSTAKLIKYKLFLRAIFKNSDADTSITDIPKLLKVRKTDMLDAPLLVGLFKPTLFLPIIPLSQSDMNYILLHELTHYKRGDLWYKWLATAVLSIHWFNPLVYIMSKRIDTECEVSCDFSVTRKLSDIEKNNYMSMILELLSRSKSNSRPLTTQMASSKKTLKRRFTMIRSKKTTSKLMSVISILVATVMLSTTVFASGILTDLTTDAYTVELINNGEKIKLSDKPFIESGEAYVPLRETLEKAMPKEAGIVDIKWNDGIIDVVVAYYQGESGMFRLKIGSNTMQLMHIAYEDYVNNSVKQSPVNAALSFNLPTVLKNSTTYVPLRNMNYMLYSFENKRDENNKLRELTYTVYGKNGDILNYAEKSTVAKISKYDSTTPEYSTEQFFYLFGDGDFENMKKYCTQSCIDTYFKDNAMFGMKTASLSEMTIAPTEHLKSSNDFKIFVNVKMTPSELSVFDPSETSASFYVILMHQPNGSYLIDNFITG